MVTRIGEPQAIGPAEKADVKVIGAPQALGPAEHADVRVVTPPARQPVTADRIRASLDGAGLRRAVDAGAIPAALYERCIAALARDLA